MVYSNQVIDMRESMSETHTAQDGHEDETRAIHRDKRRRALVLAAYQLIAEKGFEQLRTRDVAAHANVNISTLHYYFASKEYLIRGVVDHLLEMFSTSPTAGQELDDTEPLQQIRAMFLMTHHRFQTQPEMFIVLSELVLRSLRDTSLQPVLQRLDMGWHMYLQHIIMDGIQRKVFRTNINAGEMATKLIIQIKGFFFHQITQPEAIDFHSILDDVERLLLP